MPYSTPLSLRHGFLIMSVMTAGCTTGSLTRHADEQALAAPVISAERAFAARHQQVSVKQAFLEYSADDGVAVRPSGILNVKQDLASWPDGSDAGSVVWWPTYAGGSLSGDLGFTTGPAVYGGKSYGGYFTVWAKQRDGSWKWVLDQGTGRSEAPPQSKPDDPVAVVPAATKTPPNVAKAWRDLQALDIALGKPTGAAQASWLAHLHPAARVVGFGQAPSVGSAEAQQLLAKRPAQITLAHAGGGTSSAGDLGWTYGQASWTDAGAAKRGSYARVWQWQGKGWVLVAENINPLR